MRAPQSEAEVHQRLEIGLPSTLAVDGGNITGSGPDEENNAFSHERSLGLVF
jgi:hypothetical protein